MLTLIETQVVTDTATADITHLQLVGFDGAPTGLDGKVLGVAKTAAKNGDIYAAITIGVVELIAGGAIAAGEDVISDATGKPIGAAVDSDNPCGTAMNASGGAGQPVKVLLR
jgi:hypothetical protein